MKKLTLIISAIIFIYTTDSYIVYSQIDDIKNKSNQNKNNSQNDSNDNHNNSNDDPGGDILESCFSGCFEVGCSVITGFVADYTADLFQTKDVDPSILSLDINANFALAYHYSNDKSYTYVNYLPGIRANLVSFIIDFKYNILTEYTDDSPDAFTSWHLDLGFNIVPAPSFKLAIGAGVQREQFNNQYFQEYYLYSKIGMNENTDFIDIGSRLSVDYETGAYPYFEVGIHYNKRIINMPHLCGYISLGGIYENYYTSHDIWGARGGLVFNWN